MVREYDVFRQACFLYTARIYMLEIVQLLLKKKNRIPGRFLHSNNRLII